MNYCSAFAWAKFCMYYMWWWGLVCKHNCNVIVDCMAKSSSPSDFQRTPPAAEFGLGEAPNTFAKAATLLKFLN